MPVPVIIYICFSMVYIILTSVYRSYHDHNLVKHVELIRSNLFNTTTMNKFDYYRHLNVTNRFDDLYHYLLNDSFRSSNNNFELQKGYLNSTHKVFDFYQYLNSTHHHLDLHQYLNNNNTSSVHLNLNHYLNFSDSLLSSTEHNINEYILDLIVNANNQLIDSRSSSSSSSSSISIDNDYIDDINSRVNSSLKMDNIINHKGSLTLSERIKRFDWIFYLNVNPDLRQPNSSLTTKEVVLEHFRKVGFKEDRWSNISESPSLLACRRAMQTIQRDFILRKCEQYNDILSVNHNNIKKMKENHDNNISVTHDFNHNDNDNNSTTDFSILIESILSIHNKSKNNDNKSGHDDYKFDEDGNKKKKKKKGATQKRMKKRTKSRDRGNNNNNSSSSSNNSSSININENHDNNDNDNALDSSKNLTSFIASILSIHDNNKTTKVEIYRKVKKFDWKFYLKVNPDLSSINLKSKKRCLEHYIRSGYFSHRWSSPFEQPNHEACLRCMKVLHNTALFHKRCHSLISMKNQTIIYSTTTYTTEGKYFNESMQEQQTFESLSISPSTAFSSSVAPSTATTNTSASVAPTTAFSSSVSPSTATTVTSVEQLSVSPSTATTATSVEQPSVAPTASVTIVIIPK